MYISKALQNVRQRPNGNYASLACDSFWAPAVASIDNAVPSQFPCGLERACGVFFTSGGVFTDDNWMAIQAASISLAALRTYANANRSDITVPTGYASTGLGRILFQDGQRVFDCVDNTLGYITYATQFSRMYIAISNGAGTLAASTGVSSYLELTPAELKTMGADITIDGNGNGTLNNPIILNSIILK